MIRTSLLSVDPGKSMGWAYFVDARLYLCGLWNLAKDRFPFPNADAVSSVIIEDQVIYPDEKVKPASVISLAKTAARAADRMRYERVEWVKPRTWKCTGDPDVLCVRIVKALSDFERKQYFTAADQIHESHRHDVIDAIGLGLWKLNRFRA